MSLSFALFSYSIIKVSNSQAICFVDYLIHMRIFWHLSYYILWNLGSLALDLFSLPLYYSFSSCYYPNLLWYHILDLADSLHYPIYICPAVHWFCIYNVNMGDLAFWHFWINVENAWFLFVPWLSFGNWIIFAGKLQYNN